MTATCVRVPVFFGHAESVNVETVKKMTAKECRILLSQAPGLKVFDNPRREALSHARLHRRRRRDLCGAASVRTRASRTALNMWIVADNVRKGAALNAVQIAEELLRRDLVHVKDRNVFMS